MLIAEKNGDYAVEVINAYMCSAFSDTLTVEVSVSIENYSHDEQSIVLFPNPCTGKFQINIPEGNIDKTMIHITDLLGKQQAFDLHKLDNNKGEISVEYYSTGIYMVRIYNGYEWINRRMAFQ